jgi:hypothetical protein
MSRTAVLCMAALATSVASTQASATAAPDGLGEIDACTKAIVRLMPAGDPGNAGMPGMRLDPWSGLPVAGRIGVAKMHMVDFRADAYRTGDPAPAGADDHGVSAAGRPTSQESLAPRLKKLGLTGVSDVRQLTALPDTYVFSFGRTRASPLVVRMLQAELMRNGYRLKYAEPSYRVHAAMSAVIDPDYGVDGSGQWALLQVRADAAWPRVRISQGLNQPIVAVVDSGIDAKHMDLRHQIWHPNPARQPGQPANPAKLPYGKTFLDGVPEDKPPAESNGTTHGTEVAGIIAAEGDNIYAGRSVTLKGVAKLITARIKVLGLSDSTGDSSATGDTSSSSANLDSACTDNLISAIDYVIDPYNAVDQPRADLPPFTSTSSDDSAVAAIRAAADTADGATVVNLSLYQPDSQGLKEYLNWVAYYFRKVLFVTAVRDDKGMSDITTPANYSYPASYGLPNVLSVTGSTIDKCLAYMYGAGVVDIAAPSDDSLSTAAGGNEKSTDFLHGTSAATPFVSGAAALVQYLGPDAWGYQEVKEAILRSAQNMCVLGSSADLTAYENVCHRHDSWPLPTGASADPKASLCGAVRTNGILDVDAAISPPILGQVSGTDGQIHNTLEILPDQPSGKYKSGNPITVTWQQRTPAHSTNAGLALCPMVDIDIIGGSETTDLSDLSRAPLVSVAGVDVTLGSRQLVVPAVTANTDVNVRIQCSNSHLFRLSDRFTITPP